MTWSMPEGSGIFASCNRLTKMFWYDIMGMKFTGRQRKKSCSMTINPLRTLAFVSLALSLIFLGYRLRKRFIRRCTCGSLRFSWFHKLARDQSTDNPGHYHSYTFRECHRCRDFRLIKSEDKSFEPPEEWWRKHFHPFQFEGVDACLKKADLLRKPFRIQSDSKAHLSTVPSQVGSLQIPVRRAPVLKTLIDIWHKN